MKKKIVLIVLLVLPLSAYIYFSLAKHNSLFLPVVTKKVAELPQGTTLDSSPVAMTDKITILGFLGNDMVKKKETIFNINEKINAKYKDFTDFQIVMVMPEGEEEEVKKITADIKIMADISNWRFLFTKPENIKPFYETLKVKEPLDGDMGTFNLFIIDKKRSLRGRTGDSPKTGKEEFKDAYNSLIVSELHNEMTDDIKILLREYRLALKKNHNEVKREI